ncbi:polysaccharide export protein EpsE [Methylibium rhizosphaerae]|uniref:polysaccharide export protein EpsE n=1 Tax=Methylibium rhizosphaerae TaxID=2570323 RepID=UPI001126B616
MDPRATLANLLALLLSFALSACGSAPSGPEVATPAASPAVSSSGTATTAAAVSSANRLPAAVTTAVAPGGPAPAAARAQAAAAAAQAPVQAQRDYVLGPGDVVRVNVFQNPELTLEARVSETGSISYPLLGQVRLGGMSVVSAEKAIADGLRQGNFVKQPQVSVMVMQVRGHQASVLGMVNKPGRYPIEVTGLRLSELVALAGGVAPNGSDVATLSGQRDGKPFRVEVDLPNLFGATAPSADPIVLNGDVVYVDRMPVFYIYGEVQRPGALRLERNMTVMQALAAGGGLTQRGTAKGLKLHRRGPDGNVQVLQPTMDSTLRDSDVIYVRESLF